MAHLRIAIALALALFLATIVAPSGVVRASAEWCDTDPVVIVRTPGGNLVTVYLLVGAQGVEHLPAAAAASLLATSQAGPSGRGAATRVTLRIVVPNDPFGSGFPVRASASSGPLGTGTVHAVGQGRSGQALLLSFTVAVP